jgi:DNA-directed RNA polymerase specialized sigma24 family protein
MGAMVNFLIDVPVSKAGPKAKPLHEIPLKELLRTWKDARREHFIELRNQDMSYEEIGKMYGISRQAVSRVILDKD